MRILATFLAVLGLGLCAPAQTADLNCFGTPVDQMEPPSAVEIIHKLDGLKATLAEQIESSRVGTTFLAAESFHGNWLQDRKGALQSVGTFRHGFEDVLWARWLAPPDNQLIKNIEMWDGALYELVIFEADPVVLTSQESARKFLLTVTKRPREAPRVYDATAQQLEDGFAFSTPRAKTIGVLHGWMLRTRHPQRGGYDQESFTFYVIDGRSFLVFEFGKRLGSADWPQSIYLSDRFPPFAALVQKWSNERLIQELARPLDEKACPALTYEEFATDAFRSARDEVYVAELVRRGVEDTEFQQVMDSPNGMDLFIREATKAGKGVLYRNAILETIHRFENLPDVNVSVQPITKVPWVSSHLAQLIRVLPRRGGPDFSEVILKLIAAGREPEVALEYLSDRVYTLSAEFAVKLAATEVPAELQKKKARIIEDVRGRIRSESSERNFK